MVIQTAYLYATNLTLYGENVTEKWLTATQNASALEKAYNSGYYDAMQRLVKSAEWVDDKCSACGKGIEDLIESSEWYRNESPKYCPFCGLKIAEVEDGNVDN
jgi:rubrerythrin